MSSQRGFIVVTIDAGCLQRFNVGLGIGAHPTASGDLTASIADEHDFDFLLEGV